MEAVILMAASVGAMRLPAHAGARIGRGRTGSPVADGASELGRLQRLEAELAAVVGAEDYKRAATLRDELARLQMDDEVGALSANAAFYSVFSSSDLRAMEDLWAPSADVACLHPGQQALVGIDAVMDSWRDILGAGQEVQVEADQVRCAIHGSVARISCIERLQMGRMAATNLFERQADGRWLMVLHHAGMVI